MNLKEHRKANQQEKKRKAKEEKPSSEKCQSKLTFSNLRVHFCLTGLAMIIQELSSSRQTCIVFVLCVDDESPAFFSSRVNLH